MADHPDYTPTQCIEESKRMMNGNKMNMFVMELSFIGWMILGALTMGILNVLFTNPYMEAARAEAYLALKAGTFGSDHEAYADQQY